MINEHETYVSLETAKLLKEAGFDWETREYYKPIKEGYKFDWNSLPVNWNQKVAILIAQKHNRPEGYSAPTLAVAQRWLREVKNIVVEAHATFQLTPEGNRQYAAAFVDWIGSTYSYEYLERFDKDGNFCVEFDSYEEALEAGINKKLNILLHGNGSDDSSGK